MLRRRTGAHAKARPFPWVRLFLLLAVAAFNLGLYSGPSSGPAARTVAAAPVQVKLDAVTETLGQRILDKAETRAGDWYVYGGAGPTTFDCSGLVYWAAKQLGIYVPHSTYSMLAGTAHLYRIPLSQAHRGDLLFFGSGHVEFDTIFYHLSFGAHHTGTRVGWRLWGFGYAPTMAMRFR